MKKGAVLLIFCFLFVYSSEAQRGYGSQQKTWSVGILGGAANYLGDIGRRHQYFPGMQLRKTRYAAGVYSRFQLPFQLPLWLRGSLIYSEVEAADAFAKDPIRKHRNLSFRSKIVELAAVVEYGVWQKTFITGGFGGGNKHEFVLYGYAGLGLFYFDPKAKYQGEWHRLHPLSTEGQGLAFGHGNPYSLFQPSIPFGLEMEYSWRPLDFRIGLEFGWRKTFTDYIDDVSTRYVNKEDLRTAKGPIAAKLSSRTDEVTSDDYWLASFDEGEQRGDPDDKDAYGYLMLHFTYFIQREGRLMMPSF